MKDFRKAETLKEFEREKRNMRVVWGADFNDIDVEVNKTAKNVRNFVIVLATTPARICYNAIMLGTTTMATSITTIYYLSPPYVLIFGSKLNAVGTQRGIGVNF